MDYPQAFIDVVRALHLVLFAAGMGTSLYFDFRTLRSMGEPLAANDVEMLEGLHVWILSAFCCLWVTGLTLVYVRTAFDLSAFSPKLWLKLALMAGLVGNSFLIRWIVVPKLHAAIGRPLLALSGPSLIVITQVAITSMFFWTSGLILGSSVVLKTAPWEVLLPFAIGWFVLLTIGGQATVAAARGRREWQRRSSV